MINKILVATVLLLNLVSLKAQNDTELRVVAVVLTQLSEKAQKENNHSSILVYQNMWLQLKLNSLHLKKDSIFITAGNYFDKVLAANGEKIKTKCFSMRGLENLPTPNPIDQGIVKVLQPPGGFTYSVNPGYPRDLMEMYDKGELSEEDIKLILGLNSIKSEETIEFEIDQINLLKQYYEDLEKIIFKDTTSNKFLNIDGFESMDLSKVQEYKKGKIEFKQIQEAERLYKSDILPEDKLEKKKNRELEKMLKSYNKVKKFENLQKGSNF